MDLKEYIPGTASYREAKERDAEANRERRRIEEAAWIEAQKQAGIDKDPRYFEQEKVALNTVLAYKGKLLDNQPFRETEFGKSVRYSEVSSDELLVCLAEEEGGSHFTLYCVETKYPLHRTITGIEPYDLPVLATLYGPDGEIRKLPDDMRRYGALGYRISSVMESLADKKKGNHADFTTVAKTLEEQFGPLELAQA